MDSPLKNPEKKQPYQHLNFSQLQMQTPSGLPPFPLKHPTGTSSLAWNQMELLLPLATPPAFSTSHLAKIKVKLFTSFDISCQNLFSHHFLPSKSFSQLQGTWSTCHFQS